MCFQQYFIEHTTLLMLYHMKKKTIKALPRFLQTSIQSLPEVKISERTCQIQIMEPNFPIHNIISNVENHIIMLLLDIIISMGFAQFVHEHYTSHQNREKYHSLPYWVNPVVEISHTSISCSSYTSNISSRSTSCSSLDYVFRLFRHSALCGLSGELKHNSIKLFPFPAGGQEYLG